MVDLHSLVQDNRKPLTLCRWKHHHHLIIIIIIIIIITVSDALPLFRHAREPRWIRTTSLDIGPHQTHVPRNQVAESNPARRSPQSTHSLRLRPLRVLVTSTTSRTVR